MKKEIFVEFSVEHIELIDKISKFIPIYHYQKNNFDHTKSLEWGKIEFENVTMRFLALGFDKRRENMTNTLEVLYRNLNYLYNGINFDYINTKEMKEILEKLICLIRYTLKEYLDEEIPTHNDGHS